MVIFVLGLQISEAEGPHIYFCLSGEIAFNHDGLVCTQTGHAVRQTTAGELFVATFFSGADVQISLTIQARWGLVALAQTPQNILEAPGFINMKHYIYRPAFILVVDSVRC